MMARSDKSRRADCVSSPPFCGFTVHFLVLICPFNRLTPSQPKGVASIDDGIVSVVTANGVEVYYSGNVGKKVADLHTANLDCIADHGRTVAVGGDVSLSSPLEIPSLRLSLCVLINMVLGLYNLVACESCTQFDFTPPPHNSYHARSGPYHVRASSSRVWATSLVDGQDGRRCVHWHRSD